MAEANDLKGVIDQADFNDETKLGSGKDMQDRLSKLVARIKQGMRQQLLTGRVRLVEPEKAA